MVDPELLERESVIMKNQHRITKKKLCHNVFTLFLIGLFDWQTYKWD